MCKDAVKPTVAREHATSDAEQARYRIDTCSITCRVFARTLEQRDIGYVAWAC